MPFVGVGWFVFGETEDRSGFNWIRKLIYAHKH